MHSQGQLQYFITKVKAHYSEFIYCPLSTLEMFFSVGRTLSTCLSEFKQMAGSLVHTAGHLAKESRIPQNLC